jgi:hypothetical protein
MDRALAIFEDNLAAMRSTGCPATPVDTEAGY